MVTGVERCAPVFAGMNSSTWLRPLPTAGDSCTADVSAETAVQVVTHPAGVKLRSTTYTEACAGRTVDWKYDVHTMP